MGDSCTQVGEPGPSSGRPEGLPRTAAIKQRCGYGSPCKQAESFRIRSTDRQIRSPLLGDGPDYKPPTQTHARHQRPDSTPFRRSPTPPSPTHSAVRSRISGKSSVVWGSVLPQKEPFPSSPGLYPAHPQPVGLHGLQRFKTTLRINVNFASPIPCLPPPAAVRLLAPGVQQGALGEYIRIIWSLAQHTYSRRAYWRL